MKFIMLLLLFAVASASSSSYVYYDQFNDGQCTQPTLGIPYLPYYGECWPHSSVDGYFYTKLMRSDADSVRVCTYESDECSSKYLVECDDVSLGVCTAMLRGDRYVKYGRFSEKPPPNHYTVRAFSGMGECNQQPGRIPPIDPLGSGADQITPSLRLLFEITDGECRDLRCNGIVCGRWNSTTTTTGDGDIEACYTGNRLPVEECDDPNNDCNTIELMADVCQDGISHPPLVTGVAPIGRFEPLEDNPSVGEMSPSSTSTTIHTTVILLVIAVAALTT